MNRKKIMAMLLTTFLVSNLTANFVNADIKDKAYVNQYVQMYQSEPISENLVPKSEITATATTAQSGEDASKAIDGNTNTMWHTPWAGVDVANNPQSLTLDLGKTRNVSSIHVTPRQSGSNGKIKDYKIYAGDKVIAEGTWKTDAATKYIILAEPVATDNIRIEALSSIGDTLNKFVSIAEVDVYEAAEAPEKIASANNLVINAGQGGDLTSNLDAVKNLEEGTGIIRFTTTGTGIQSLFSISNNTLADEHFHMYINGGKVGYELRKQGKNVSTGVVSNELNPGINTLAFRAQKGGGYSIYLNGEQVLNENLATANFLQSLEGANTFKLGTTDRVSGNEYNFTGKIDFFEMYAQPLADRYLKEITGQTKAADLPLPEGALKTEPIDLFAPGDLGSPNFRIPAMYTTKDGTVLATIDVRNNGGHDAPNNNIDVGLKRSTDGGITWDEGKVILDYPGKSAAIDTAMVQDEETGRIFLIVTHFSEGYGFPNSETGSGYKEIDGKRYLIVKDITGNEYTVREEGKVYNSNNELTNYTVDEDKNLYKDGVLDGHILTSAGDLKMMGTAFISMIHSDDDGVTWSKPTDLNKEAKQDWMRFFGTGPGRGHQIKNGEYAGRLLFPIYVTNKPGFQSSACLYSDDNGETWNFSETVTDGRDMGNGVVGSAEHTTSGEQLTECQVVEMPNGQIKMFMRNTGSKVKVATSFDGGATWDNVVESEDELPEPYCQLSVMNYSQKIDGKDAIIFSNPAGGGRTGGTIRVGLINEVGTHENGETKYDFEWKYNKLIAQGTYAYSCLSEMPNGEIGVFYEGTGSQEMSFTRMNVDYLKADLLADAPTAKFTSITSLDADANYAPGATANLKVTFDQTVSLFGDRNLTLVIDGKEVSGEVTKISGTEYKVTVTLPQNIAAGTHTIAVKANSGLEVVNTVGKVTDLSQDIETDSTIVVEEDVVVDNKVFTYSNLTITSGSENGNISNEIDNVKDLEEGTIVMKFDNEGGTAFQTLLSISNNTQNRERIYLFVNGNNQLGLERQSADGNKLHRFSPVTLNDGMNTVAFKVEKNVGYSIFLNGEKVSTLADTDTRFIKGISGLNSVNIGRSDRLSDGENPFTGQVDFITLYRSVLADEELIAMTGEVEEVVDKSELQAVVNGCEDLVEAEYTEDTWSALEAALTVANTVLAKDDATQAEVNEAKADLEEAKANLVKVENPVEDTATFNLKADKEVVQGEAVDIKLSIDDIAEHQIVQSVDAILAYDTEKFELGENAITAIDGTKTFVSYKETEQGKIRVIITSLGEPVVSGSDIVNIKLTAKDSLGNSDVSLTGQYSDGTDIKEVKASTIGIEVIKKEIPVDKSELQALVDECLVLNESDYTVETWSAFNTVLESARSILSNGEATQAQVDLVLGQLQAAKDGLVEKEESSEVFKGHLEITVEVAQGIKDFTDVVPAVKAEFDAALAEAVALLANAEATQEQVNKSFDRLSNAIHMLEFKGNKEQLNNLLEQIASLDSKDYTKESWEALQAVINREDIQSVINDKNALQEDIEKAYNDVFTAFSELVEASEQVNKDKLNNLIDKVGSLNADEYIDTTWNNFANALAAAQGVSANAEATQAEVDEAYNNLLRAYLNLRLKPSKDKLEDLINKAEGLDASKYTAKSYKAVEKALKSARNVYADEKATVEDIAKAEKNLEVAMANLEEKDNSNSGGSNGSNNGSGTNGGSTSNGGKLPNTGGTSAVAVGLLGTISAALGSVMFKRKRK